MYKIGWFSSGRGQGSLNLLHAIVAAIKEGTIKAELAYVFCSREKGDADGSDRYLQQVNDYGLNLVCVSSKRFSPELRKQGKGNPAALVQWRKAYDRAVMKQLGGRHADITVLAGYMLVASPEMCSSYAMINLHPAAPDGPAGTWQEVIWQLIGLRSEKSGNMMHLVIEELDKGPPITFSTFPLRGEGFEQLWKDMDEKIKSSSLAEVAKKEGEQNPLFYKIRQEGAKREIPLVVQTVKAFADGHIVLNGRNIIADGKILEGPYCLTEAIEKQIMAMK
ncbi:MAG: formyltransferase family protein [Pseudomonadota bacterium]